MTVERLGIREKRRRLVGKICSSHAGSTEIWALVICLLCSRSFRWVRTSVTVRPELAEAIVRAASELASRPSAAALGAVYSGDLSRQPVFGQL